MRAMKQNMTMGDKIMCGMSLARYETFVDNIASGLTWADPVHALAYLDNAAD